MLFGVAFFTSTQITMRFRFQDFSSEQEPKNEQDNEANVTYRFQCCFGLHFFKYTDFDAVWLSIVSKSMDFDAVWRSLWRSLKRRRKIETTD